jgi:hypothetical protein
MEPLIEKNIHLPDFNSNQFLYKMEVGDSVLVSHKRIYKMRPFLSLLKKRDGLIFISKTMDNGVRIWRIQ